MAETARMEDWEAAADPDAYIDRYGLEEWERAMRRHNQYVLSLPSRRKSPSSAPLRGLKSAAHLSRS